MNIQAKAYLANKQQFTSLFESQKKLKTASLKVKRGIHKNGLLNQKGSHTGPTVVPIQERNITFFITLCVE